ncbi:hypothetical protein GLAREA_10220 [Glarea lozoyensis ATCC 20868]|uniref:Tctex-1 n=1 Tax=Glarea lozoyensis (strain ATCC 20868 / MF5171) TaxID=1116229 RepID=S3DR83_GLAL2|nr:uncharacterized protein GLAREA_10220 [Glarea lozoyensis ATCC 20868]EPE34526.1 hypothetical protein GLAREA_10220 [Glarea lozoyensis ATCC 20868]
MATPPISFTRLKQIANDACQSALGGADYYEHGKTEVWNTTIINSILKSLISESSPTGGSPAFKYAVNSTIIQHLVPTSALNKSRAVQEPTPPRTGEADSKISTSDAKPEATSTDGKPHVGRRGMHSATGAFWNEKTDGMWSFKYEGGENKGLDVVVSVIWIAI